MTSRRRRAPHAARAHKWPLGAFAQLLDAAHSRNGVWIDVHASAANEPFFVVRDRGQGLSSAQLHARTAVQAPVREWLKGDTYACPWQAAAFRLGSDVTILSKTPDACYVALLSRERVVDLRDPESEEPNIVMEWHNSVTDCNRLTAAIFTYSPWQSASQISRVFDSISPTGTLVAISSLKRDLQQAELELDLTTDRYDIRLSSPPHKEHNHFISSIRLSHSLRSYLQLLYLDPTFRIYLRNRIVRERRLSTSMFGRQDFVYNYTPTTESHSTSAPPSKRLVFRFGFDHSAHENEYGMLLYHKRRLVKPYLKLGFQIQPRNQIRVVAIVEADHLVPTSNMQSFEEDDAYQDLIFALGQALKLFWAQYGSMTNAYRSHCNDPMLKWVRCDVCARWRQLGPNVPHPSDTSCAQWTCDMNAGATNVCNQPDDACLQQVPVRVLEKRPISPVSPPKECRKRLRAPTSPLGNLLKRPRHLSEGEANLEHVESGQHNDMHCTTSPIPNLQSPIGFDSCTPEMGASDGAELRTDPFSLNECDSPHSRSTSSPGNMLEKAARAKPLPSTVRHADSELKGLEAPVLPSRNAHQPDLNHVQWGSKENVPEACAIQKGASAADDHPHGPCHTSQPLASSQGDPGNKGKMTSIERPNEYEETEKATDDKMQSDSGEEEHNHAVVSESRPRATNATIRPIRTEVARQGRPVSVPLVREVVVHHSAQFVDIDNRNSTVKVFPENRQHLPDELILTPTDGSVPVVSEHPQSFVADHSTSGSVAQDGYRRQLTVKVANHVEPSLQPLSNSRGERDTTEAPRERDNEEEAIKLLLSLRAKEKDDQSGSGKASMDVDPNQNYETKAVAEFSGAIRLQDGVGPHVDDWRQTSRDIPDPFGDKSKPVTPADNLLQTPTKAVPDISQRGLPTHFSSMPGMPSPNTANPFLDVTTEDVLEAAPLNGIDISKDFLDLGAIGPGLKTPSQRKPIPKRASPQDSCGNVRNSQLHEPTQLTSDSVPPRAAPELDPPTGQQNQSNPTNQVLFDEGNAGELKLRRDIGEVGIDPSSIPSAVERSCFGHGTRAQQAPDDGFVRHCARGFDGANEVKVTGSRERMASGTIRISDISSMIPWSQIAATAAAAGAVAAAAAARDTERPNQPKAPERHSNDEGSKLRVSQEELENLKKELQDQRQLTDTYKEKFQELICTLAPNVPGGVAKLMKNPHEIDVLQLSRDVLNSVTEKAKEEASAEQLQAIESCRASEQIACSSLERLRGLVRTFLEEAVGLTTQSEQDKPVDRHFEEYLNALDVFPP